MSWLNPWGWLWLGLGVPIVLLYVLRIRRRRIPVATTQFWEEVLAESRPRAWWQRLRHLVSLLLQLLLLGLLTAAIADPLSASQSRDRRLVVLVIDRSASMSGRTAAGATRFAEAIRAAHREIDALREWDEGVVISAAGGAWVECGRTSHPGVLRRALDGIAPSDRAGGVGRGLALAAQLSAPGRVKDIVVFTDQPPDPGAADVRWRRVGEPAPNLAITALSARPRADRRTAFRILVGLGNFTPEAREVSASIRRDGQPIDGVSAELAAGEARSFVVTEALPEGGVLEVRLIGADDDGLAADNVARLAIPPPRVVRVAVVAQERNWFLEQALTAVPLVEVKQLGPGAALPAEAYDLVVYDGVTPAGLPPLNSLFLEPDADTALWRMGEPLRNVLISTLADDSPLLRHTRFERVTIPAAHPIIPVGGTTVLSSFGAPLLQVWEGSGIRRAALTIDLQRSDLALRTAFPILVANLLHWYAGTGGGEIAALQPGAAGPGGAWEKVGLYRDAGEPVCVNLTDAAESNLAVPDGTEPGETDRAAAGGGPWWRWLVLTALALVAVEWGLHQRRWVE